MAKDTPGFEHGEQDVRIRQVSRMVPTTGLIPGDIRLSIVRSLREHMEARELSQGDVAKALGTTAVYLNQVINDSGTMAEETRSQILRDANNWLDREARAIDQRRPSKMVETKVARKLVRLANDLTEHADIALAYGPAGIGKSFCADVIAARLNATLVYVHPDCATNHKFLRTLYNAVSRRKRNTPVELAEIAEKLRMPDRVATRHLVIIDQAHELADKSLRSIMAISDLAGCSFLLLGTVRLFERVQLDVDPLFGQLSSRIGEPLDLGEGLSVDGVTPPDGEAEWLFTRQDVEKLFDSRTIKFHRGAIDLLLSLANYAGHSLRVMMRIARLAQESAAKRNHTEVTDTHVEAAMKRCKLRTPARAASASESAERRKTA